MTRTAISPRLAIRTLENTRICLRAMAGDRARARLAGSRFADVRWVAETGSTNADAAGPGPGRRARGHRRWWPTTRPPAGAGSAARGRRRRAPSLLVSVLLRPPAAVDRAPAPRWPSALAAAEAIDAVAGVAPGLKWPNDLVWPATARAGPQAGRHPRRGRWPPGRRRPTPAASGRGGRRHRHQRRTGPTSCPTSSPTSPIAAQPRRRARRSTARTCSPRCSSGSTTATARSRRRRPGALLAEWRAALGHARPAGAGRPRPTTTSSGTAVDVTDEGHLVVDTDDGDRRDRRRRRRRPPPLSPIRWLDRAARGVYGSSVVGRQGGERVGGGGDRARAPRQRRGRRPRAIGWTSRVDDVRNTSSAPAQVVERERRVSSTSTSSQHELAGDAGEAARRQRRRDAAHRRARRTRCVPVPSHSSPTVLANSASSAPALVRARRAPRRSRRRTSSSARRPRRARCAPTGTTTTVGGRRPRGGGAAGDDDGRARRRPGPSRAAPTPPVTVMRSRPTPAPLAAMTSSHRAPRSSSSVGRRRRPSPSRRARAAGRRWRRSANGAPSTTFSVSNTPSPTVSPWSSGDDRGLVGVDERAVDPRPRAHGRSHRRAARRPDAGGGP